MIDNTGVDSASSWSKEALSVTRNKSDQVYFVTCRFAFRVLELINILASEGEF